MSSIYYKINKADLYDLFGRLSGEYRALVSYRKGDKLMFGGFDPAKESEIELGGIRQGQPVKSFLNPAREKVSQESGPKRTLVAGVKACDLASLPIQDFVFLKNDPVDPFYEANRANTLIISADCTNVKETCFCLAMDGRPYPTAGFDLNLSITGDAFLAETGSPKGEDLVRRFKTFFKAAADYDIARRQEARDRASLEVKGFIDKRGIPHCGAVKKGAVSAKYNTVDFWKDISSTCVECGACNLVCPTCHCFLLYDENTNAGPKRSRIWDSCLYNTFARVAGGANPRRHLFERLRNRFDKKFAFFPQVLDTCACTGCGRCIDACPGDIDIREVLKGLVNETWSKPPHE